MKIMGSQVPWERVIFKELPLATKNHKKHVLIRGLL
jgi:hypothetical protein